VVNQQRDPEKQPQALRLRFAHCMRQTSLRMTVSLW
jgi:hypothetical protein